MSNKDKIYLLEKLITHDLKIINYFQNDLTKYKLLILVLKNHFEKKTFTIEEVIEELPKNISSRAHKLNCITDATLKNFLIKETSNSDMRKKYLKPSDALLVEFEIFSKILEHKKL